MDITQTIPDYNPADATTLDGLNSILQEKIFLNMQKVCPGIVQSYDRIANRAVIKPAITGVATLGQKVPREAEIDIPVFSMSGGGIVMSFPVRAGDKGWLIACDRDISIFKQMLEESSPNTYQKHRYKDSFFLPDKINKLNISEDDAEAIVITTEDGSTKFTLQQGTIKLKSNIEIILDSPQVTITGNLNTETGLSGAIPCGSTVLGMNAGNITGSS